MQCYHISRYEFTGCAIVNWIHKFRIFNRFSTTFCAFLLLEDAGLLCSFVGAVFGRRSWLCIGRLRVIITSNTKGSHYVRLERFCQWLSSLWKWHDDAKHQDSTNFDWYWLQYNWYGDIFSLLALFDERPKWPNVTWL